MTFSNRVKRILISADILKILVTEGNFCKVLEGTPKDAQLVNVGYDNQTNVFFIFVTHDSFEPVPEASIVPILDIKFERIIEQRNEIKFKEFL